MSKPYMCGDEISVYVPDGGCDCNYTLAQIEPVDNNLSSYVLQLEGRAVGDVINIPKDKVVNHGELRTVINDGDPYPDALAGDKYIALNIAVTDEQVYVPLGKLGDMSNYYNKSEVDQLINSIDVGGYLVVNSLPATGDTNIIYLVPSGDGYERWIYTTPDGWINIGDTEIDLSEYLKITTAESTYQKLIPVTTGASQTLSRGGSFQVTETTADANNKASSLTKKTLTLPNDYYNKTEADARYYRQSQINTMLCDQHPVGSMYVTSTNTNPGSYLCGTWSLVDYDLAYNHLADSGVTWSDYYTKTARHSDIVIMGKRITVRLTWTTKTSYADTELNMCFIAPSTLGLTAHPFKNYIIGQADTGASLAMFDFGEVSGTASSVLRYLDASSGSGWHKVDVDTIFIVQFELMFAKNAIDQSKCDKFYWKRVS